MIISKEIFINSIQKGKAVENWIKQDKKAIEKKLGVCVSAMQGFDQRNPHHCYNLLSHCLHTCDNLEYFGKRDAVVRTAAFFHDLGKPVVVKEKQGRLVFYGHADMSAKLVKPMLLQMGYSKAEVLDIIFLIGHHDDFISYVLADKYLPGKGKTLITAESVKKYYAALRRKYAYISTAHLWELLEELLALMTADCKAQSEYVYMQGVLVDSREEKVKRLEKIKKYIFNL